MTQTHNNIFLVDKKSSTTYLWVAFFNPFFSPEDIHLLEHVMLNPERVLRSGKKLKDYDVYEFLNGKVTWTYISFYGHVLNQDIIDLSEVLADIVATSLLRDNSDSIIWEELTMISRENYLEIESLENTATIYDYAIQYYIPAISNDVSPEVSVYDVYEKIIEKGNPYFVIAWDEDNIYVQSAMESCLSVMNDFSSWDKVIGSLFIVNYNFNPNNYSSFLQHKNQNIGLYIPILSTYLEVIKSYKKFSFMLFFKNFLYYVLFNYIRRNLKSDYSLEYIYRWRFFGWEIASTFFCNVEFSQIISFLKERLYLTKDFFNEMREYVIKKIILNAEWDIDHLPYHLFHSMVFDGEFKMYPKLIHEIKSIDYELFVDIYDLIMKNLCVYPIND